MALTLQTFRHELARCFKGTAPKKVLVALSGGADSMCLTHLLSRALDHMEILAATIDHRYRPDSAREAAEVGSIVRRWAVSHRIRPLTYDKDPRFITNFEEMARELRYQNLRDICVTENIDTLFLAHNQDDCIETFLQRLLMNSTMYGLAGLVSEAGLPLTPRAPSENIRVVRPLLRFAKRDIRRYCESQAVPWFEDASNADTRLTQRNKLRYMVNEYIPSVQETRPGTRLASRLLLLESMDRVRLYVAHCEKQRRCLEEAARADGYHFNEKNATITCAIPAAALLEFEGDAVARWLYVTVQRISSSRHYHWSYAKFSRKVVPKIRGFLVGTASSTKFTYVNVVFSLEKLQEMVRFVLKKQPPIREDAINMPMADGKWVLFDRTWWIRACFGSDKLQQLFLMRYTSAMKDALLEAFPAHRRGRGSLNSRTGVVPVIVDNNSRIVALPTHNFYRDGISGECVMKGGASFCNAL